MSQGSSSYTLTSLQYNTNPRWHIIANDPKYRCCRNHSHVRTGAQIMGGVEMFFISLLVVVAIGDWILHPPPLYYFICQLSFAAIRAITGSTMLYAVYKKKNFLLVIPHIVVQLLTTLAFFGYVAFLLLHLSMVTPLLPRDERIVETSELGTHAFGAALFGSLQAWFFYITYRCCVFLHHKQFVQAHLPEIRLNKWSTIDNSDTQNDSDINLEEE